MFGGGREGAGSQRKRVCFSSVKRNDGERKTTCRYLCHPKGVTSSSTTESQDDVVERGRTNTANKATSRSAHARIVLPPKDSNLESSPINPN